MLLTELPTSRLSKWLIDTFSWGLQIYENSQVLRPSYLLYESDFKLRFWLILITIFYCHALRLRGSLWLPV
jgi:hypothetical protein